MYSSSIFRIHQASTSATWHPRRDRSICSVFHTHTHTHRTNPGPLDPIASSSGSPTANLVGDCPRERDKESPRTGENYNKIISQTHGVVEIRDGFTDLYIFFFDTVTKRTIWGLGIWVGWWESCRMGFNFTLISTIPKSKLITNIKVSWKHRVDGN